MSVRNGKANKTDLLASLVEDDVEAPPRSEARKESLRTNDPFAALFDGNQTEIRILIVADGNITFSDSPVGDGFSLTELINNSLLPSALPCEKLVIVKAHRIETEDDADVPGFKFDVIPNNPPYDHPISYYHQIWLFGIEGEYDENDKTETKPNPFTLSDSELRVLTNFMNNGGGVFATGDHEDLGAALCGRVPRVRSMRKWFYFGRKPLEKAPGRNDGTRIDTLREGLDVGFNVKDQEDAVPQEIRPRLVKDGTKSRSHDLLSRGDSFVKVLPDHMHEGECVLPTESQLKAKLRFFTEGPKDEYPKLPKTDTRLSPEVVAIATSAGGYLVDQAELLPVEPCCYNVIVAYKGHCIEWINKKGDTVHLGNVVVDASFHHFLDINLKGLGSDINHQGFHDANGNPTEDYLAFKQYYTNIRRWLCPQPVKDHYYMNLLLTLRYLSPLIEEIRAVPNPDWQEVLTAGVFTQNAITHRLSQAEATQCALAVVRLTSPELQNPELQNLVAGIIDPWHPSSPSLRPLSLIFNFGLMSKILLGGAMLNLAQNLSTNIGEARRELEKWKPYEERLRKVVSDGAQLGLKAFASLLSSPSTGLSKFLLDLEPFLQ